MNKMINKNILISIISIALILILVTGIAVIFDNSPLTSMDNVISAETEQVVQSNGQVPVDYKSPYASMDSAEVTRILDSDGLKAFLTNTDSKLYGYLAKDITLSETELFNYKGYIFDKKLDGAGHTITLVQTGGNMSFTMFNAGTGQFVDRGKTVEMYVQGGIAPVAGEGALIENCNFIFNPPSSDFIFVADGIHNSFAVGMVFGYMYKGAEINNCSLKISKSFKHSAIFDGTNNLDNAGYNMTCLGGFAGVVDQAYISNSKIEIDEGTQLYVFRKGIDKGWPKYLKGDSTLAIGGIVGNLCNGGEINNITTAGKGNFRAEAVTSPRINSGCGSVVGINDTDLVMKGYEDYWNNLGTRSAGKVDGVINGWTGIAEYMQSASGGNVVDAYNQYGANGQAFNYIAGQVGGLVNSGTISNVFYLFGIENLIKSAMNLYESEYSNGNSLCHNETGYCGKGNKYSSCDTVGAKVVGYDGDGSTGTGTINTDFEGVPASGNNSAFKSYVYTSSTETSDIYINLWDDVANDYVNVTDNAVYSKAATLTFEDTTLQARPIIKFDVSKLTGLYKAGMFIWSADISAQGGAIESKSIKYYEKANNVEDALTYTNYASTDYSGDSFIARNIVGLKMTINLKTGCAVYTKLDEANSKLIDLGEKTYNKEVINIPALLLYTNSDRTDAFKCNSTGVTNSYVNPSIWKAYKNNIYNKTYSIDEIIDVGTYDLMVYNGIKQSKFDFVDETARLVAYREDNTYHNASTARWQPVERIKINQKEVRMYWEPIIVDGLTYTTPQDVVYASQLYNWEIGLVQDDILESDREGMTATLKYYKNGKEVTYEKVKDVANYNVEVSGCSNSNYTYVSSFVTSYDFKITKRKLTMKFNNLASFVYDGKVKDINWVTKKADGTIVDCSKSDVTYNIVINNVLDNNILDFTLTDSNNTKYRKAGSFEMKISLASGDLSQNYELPDITNASQISSSDETFEQLSSKVRYEYDMFDNTKILGIIRTIDIEKAEVRFVQENLVSPSIEGTNYSYIEENTEVAYVGGVEYKYDSKSYEGYNSVNCLVLGINVDGKYEEIYTDYKYKKLSGVNPNYQIDVTDDDENRVIVSQVGAYIVTLSFDDEIYTNYKLETYQLVFEVEELTATFEKDTSGLQPEVTYNGQDYTEVYKDFIKVSGVTLGDTNRRGIGITGYSYYKGEYLEYDGAVITNEKVTQAIDCGSYIAVAEHNLDTRASYKYNDSNIYYAFKINPIDITITPDNVVKKYGEDYNQELTYSQVGEFVASDNVVLKLTAGVEKMTQAGKYKIDLDLANCQNIQNYNIKVVDNTAFEVTQIEIRLRIIQAKFEYGKDFDYSKVQYLILTEETILDGDDASFGFESTVDKYSDIGEYDFNVFMNGTSGGSYKLVLYNKQSGEPSQPTMEIIPQNITVTSDNVDITYGDVVPELTKSLSSEFYAYDYIVESLTVNYKQFDNVGEYIISYSITGDKAKNYSINHVAGKLTVKPKEVTVNTISDPLDNIYCGKAIYPQVTFDGVVNSDILNALFITSKDDIETPSIDVGTYRASVCGVDNENYIYTVNEADYFDYTINKRLIKLEVSDARMQYGEDEVTIDGDGYFYQTGSNKFAEEDILNGRMFVKVVPDENFDKLQNPGVYANAASILITGEASGNYDIQIVKLGDIVILGKPVNTLTLVKDSVVYSGENLINEIAANTKGLNGLTIIVRDAEGNVVSSIVDAGVYQVTLVGDENNFVGEASFEFTIEKGTQNFEFTKSNVSAKYNKITFIGIDKNKELEYSLDNGESWVSGSSFTDGVAAETTITFLVRAAANSNCVASAPVSISVRTGYSPIEFNNKVAALGSTITFDKIAKVKEVQALLSKVSEVDMVDVDQTALNSAVQQMNDLIEAVKSAANSANTVAKKVSGSTNTQATTAAIGFASTTLLVGAAMLCIRRKKNDGRLY